MTQQNRFKQNEEKIIARVEEMRQAGKISDEQARQMIQVGQQQANSPQSMQDMLAGEHAFKMRNAQSGDDGITLMDGTRRAKGPPTPEEQMTRQQYEEQMRLQAEQKTGLPSASNNMRMQKPTGLITGDVPHHDQPYVPPKEDYSILPRIVPERPTFGSTMKYMGGGLMDAGRSVGRGLGSMGRSLGAGTKSLFNDPSRMAMLRGGLSMMDPNTYYDKKGFGSVFTGMNTGLGAAEQGYKNVLDRRETEADTLLKNSGRGGKLPASYLQVLNRWQNEKNPAIKKMLYDRLQVLNFSGEGTGRRAKAKSIGDATGGEIGQQRAALQTSEDAYAYSSNLISNILNHPGLGGVIGKPSTYGLLRIPGTDEANFRAMLEQLDGEVFLAAFQNLKGGGHVTDIEGAKAAKSRARMDSAQTEEDFKKSLIEYLGVLDVAMKKARKQAGGDLSGTPSKFVPPSAPTKEDPLGYFSGGAGTK